MGVVHKADPNWASHIPVLIKVLEATKGSVLELGAGILSTPLLYALCFDQNREFISYDNDGRFIDQLSRFGVRFTDNWDFDLPECSVAFIDQKPAIARKETIKRLTNVDMVVVHDTQERADEFYGFDEIYPLFKYRYDYNKFANQTTVLSNKHDVYNIFHNTHDK